MSDLSDSAQHEHYITLSNSLPPPVLAEPEYRDRRLVTAVETFNALRPGDAYEAQLAERIVLCGAHANECLRLAGHYRDDFAKMTRCRAQAASMMRAECSAKRTLEREQKVRLAVEAVAGGAVGQLGATPGEAVVAGAAPAQSAAAGSAPAQSAAAGSAPAQSAVAGTGPGQPAAATARPQQAELQAAPPPVQVTAAAPPPAPEPPAAAPPRLAAANPAPVLVQAGSAPQAASAPPPSPEAMAKAEAFAHENIVAAAQIRHDGGVTPQSKAYFRHMVLPTDPAAIDALVRGSSDVLTMLDEVGGEMLEAAD